MLWQAQGFPELASRMFLGIMDLENRPAGAVGPAVARGWNKGLDQVSWSLKEGWEWNRRNRKNAITNVERLQLLLHMFSIIPHFHTPHPQYV